MDISVIITSYNKGLYIKACLLGVLNQDFKGDFEVILADDCSSDNTFMEINSLNGHHNFNKVKYTRHGKNKGLMANFIWALNKAKGKYLAFCDADDFWVDNNKLTFQMNILTENTGLIMVGSLMKFNDSRNQVKLAYEAKYLKNLSDGILPKAAFYDVFKVPFHISSFLCVNNNTVKRQLEGFRYSVSNDIVFWCLLSDIGDCYFSQRIVGIENHVVNGYTQVENHLSLNSRLNKVVMWKKISKKLKQNGLKNFAHINYNNRYTDLNKRLMNTDLFFIINVLKKGHYPVGVCVFILRVWFISKLSRRLFNI